ncbi:MAG TPA: glycosyltransferase family 87 protein [Bacteroidia bacterium]|nr:glycosyltransferase family 87 protein [Bacteroidia bacterium]
MTIPANILTVLTSKYLRISLLALLCLLLGIQALYNDEIANFIIFKTSSQRFLNHQNLYDFIQYKIIYDKFFYAPQFALFFLPFALLPIKLSIVLWLLLGATLFYFAIQNLPLSNTQKAIIFFIALFDLVNSFQNLQTNALNTAFILFIFSFLRNQKYMLAALCVAFCLSIKIYPAAAALLFLFYPNKLKFLFWCTLLTALFFLLPLLVVPKDYFFSCLDNWLKSISEDATDKFISNSPSLIGINYTWFSTPINHFYIQLTGLLLVFVPLFKIAKKETDTTFILLYLSFIMIFVVIFNHAAESPTYIVAITGAAIWYAVSPKNVLNNALLILLIVACILLPTDIFPHDFRKNYLEPLKIRVIPCLLIWLKLFYELLTYKPLQSSAAV